MPDRRRVDYRVAFTMRHGDTRRRFELVIPAASPGAARFCCDDLAAAIGTASGGVWQLDQAESVTVEEIRW
jgi:hypothetical protein